VSVLILTVHLESEAQARFEADRKRYFPSRLNRVPAHLTLFDRLRDSDDLRLNLVHATEAQTEFGLRITGVTALGQCVSYIVDSNELLALHGHLSTLFVADLTAQDRQPFRPHVVIQNKVTLQEAERTRNQVSLGFTPFVAFALGLDLWYYRDGPWESVQTYRFIDRTILSDRESPGRHLRF
jgi:2'-5' RNA ligase